MAMNALRCLECGDVRWSPTNFSHGQPERCELCGGELAPERRLPGHALAEPAASERRDAPVPVGR